MSNNMQSAFGGKLLGSVRKYQRAKRCGHYIGCSERGTMSLSNPTDNGEGYENEDMMDDPALLELLEFHEGGRMSEDDMVANDEGGVDDFMADGGDEIVDDEEEEEDSDDEESDDDEDDDEGDDEDDDGSDDSAAAKVSCSVCMAKIVWGDGGEFVCVFVRRGSLKPFRLGERHWSPQIPPATAKCFNNSITTFYRLALIK